MRDTKIFIIDLNPSTNAGCKLRKIIDSCPNMNISFQYWSSGNGYSVPCNSELADTISGCQYDLIIMVLSKYNLKQPVELFQSIKNVTLKIPVFFVIDNCRPEEMFSLLKSGGTDFITPPFKEIDILPRLWRLIEYNRQMRIAKFSLKEKLGLKQLVGGSPLFYKEIEKVPIVAKCDASVLISGETGTGKEMFARAIHYLSPRASKPFIPFNCGAVPADLMENELFGHVQGAFTGASTAQSGLITEANSGTLLLDDIDCLPLFSQVKLLRFLQEKEYRQLGSSKIYQADVRLISTTNTDLQKAVNEGKLRQDLYYRINVIPLSLPSLRERKEDIPLLVDHFLEKFSIKFNKGVSSICSKALQILILHDWPGNVRELEHVIERAVLFSEHQIIRKNDIKLPPKKDSACKTSFQEAKAQVINKFEKNYIETLLLAFKGNISKAAQAAQKNRRAFWELMRKHQIDVQTFKHG